MEFKIIPLVFVAAVILMLTTWNINNFTFAQHLVRSRSKYASPQELLVLKPIQNVEIVTLNSSSVTNSYFTLSSFNNHLFVNAVTFIPNQLLSQIPFTCGTQQYNCRTVKCFLTCANVTYSLALRCKQDASAPISSLRTIAITQELFQESYDDLDQITLRIAQRLPGGSVCQFVFANNLLGRRTVGGRLRGNVEVSVERSFPQFSGVPFLPDPSLWNDTRTTAVASSYSTSSAYVRCATTGKVSFVQNASSLSNSPVSNWTDACCFDPSSNVGNCSISFSSTIPSFYFHNRSKSVSSSSKVVWARPDSKLSSISEFLTNGSTLCASNSGVILTLNISFISSSSIEHDFKFKESIFSLLELDPNNPPNRDSANGIGLFNCLVDDNNNNNNSSTSSSNSSIIVPCIAFASNRSIVIVNSTTNITPSNQNIYIPLCMSSSSSSSSTTFITSPLGPIDDASSSSITASSTSVSLPLSVPQGSCFNIRDPTRCVSPCVWSTTFGSCLWGDSLYPTSAPSTPVQLKSTTCAWSPSSLMGVNATLSPDVNCNIQKTDDTLSTLLAGLCIQRGFGLNQVGWCIQSAFVCPAADGSIENVVNTLMAFFCVTSFLTCTDQSFACRPNVSSSSSAFFTTPAPLSLPPPAFVLSVTANRSEISVTNEIRSDNALIDYATNIAHGSTSVVNPYNVFYVPVGVFLVATGAYFNLTAIRVDLQNAKNGIGPNGFTIRMSADSSNLGRFDLSEKFNDLFPDPDFAITDVYGNGKNTSLADSLVIRISKTNSFKPLPGKTQYLDVNPAMHSKENNWMTPTSQFSFASVTLAFTEDAPENCSLLGLAIAVIVFGLLSGLGGWIIVGAVQATLIFAQSACSPDQVRNCASGTLDLVNIARVFWPAADQATGIIQFESRKVFWTQFCIIGIVFVLHLILVRTYKHLAPLRGSAERTLWFPAPAFFLSGVFAIGTVQTAWIVIFSDELAVLRVFSFFCFAALLGTILPWWFLKTFREEENYFQSYDFTAIFKTSTNSSLDQNNNNNNRDNNNNNSNSQKQKERQKEMRNDDDNQRLHSNSRVRKRNQNQELNDDDDDDNSDDIINNNNYNKTRKGKNNKNAQPNNNNAVQLLTAETSNMSLRHSEHIQKKLDKKRNTWSSTAEKFSYLFFSLFLPTGWWPHTRGMAPVRDLIHPKASFFPWVTLVILGFTGLNFAYIGVAEGLCRANFVNQTLLQAAWVIFTIYWRPFRIPILNLLFAVARILDLSASIVATNWIDLGVPATAQISNTIRNLVVASLVFMLIFALLTFLVKVKEMISNVVRESDHLEQVHHDEKSLDVALNDIIFGNGNKTRESIIYKKKILNDEEDEDEKKKRKNISFFEHDFITGKDTSKNDNKKFPGSRGNNDDDNNNVHHLLSVATSTVVPLSAVHSIAGIPKKNFPNNSSISINNSNNNNSLLPSSISVTNRSRRSQAGEELLRDQYYDFNYFHGQDDFDTSPRIDQAEQKLLPLQQQQQNNNSISSHRIEIWWDRDGDNRINNSTSSDEEEAEFFEQQQQQQKRNNNNYNGKRNIDNKLLQNFDDLVGNHVDLAMVQARSQRTANLLSAFGSLVKIHEVPPNRSLPPALHPFGSSSSNRKNKNEDFFDDDEDIDDEEDENDYFYDENNDDDRDEDDDDFENNNNREDLYSFSVEQRERKRFEKLNKKHLLKKGQKEQERLARKRNKLRRKGYRLIVTFADTRDALTAARSLSGKFDDPSGTRIFCELLPDNFDLSAKKLKKKSTFSTGIFSSSPVGENNNSKDSGKKKKNEEKNNNNNNNNNPFSFLSNRKNGNQGQSTQKKKEQYYAPVNDDGFAYL